MVSIYDQQHKAAPQRSETLLTPLRVEPVHKIDFQHIKSRSATDAFSLGLVILSQSEGPAFLILGALRLALETWESQSPHQMSLLFCLSSPKGISCVSPEAAGVFRSRKCFNEGPRWPRASFPRLVCQSQVNALRHLTRQRILPETSRRSVEHRDPT